MNPRISVVIASRNYGRYLRGALESVLRQTVPVSEIIVVDDGSTDDTPTVLHDYQQPHIRIFRTDGLGQARAKNLGIMHAHGTWIAFLDGDDEWLPTKLERQLPWMANPQVGVVYSRRVLMDATGREQPTPPGELLQGRITEALLERNPICFSSTVVRRTLFEAVGLFNTQQSLAIDYDLWLRMAPHTEFAFAAEALVRYRTGHANLSSRLGERVQTVLSILRRAVWRRPNRGVSARTIGEAWGSTYRTLAYMQRSRSLLSAVASYWRAAWYDHRYGTSLRNTFGTLWRRLR